MGDERNRQATYATVSRRWSWPLEEDRSPVTADRKGLEGLRIHYLTHRLDLATRHPVPGGGRFSTACGDPDRECNRLADAQPP